MLKILKFAVAAIAGFIVLCVLGLGIALWWVGLISFAPIYKIETNGLEDKRLEIDMNSFMNSGSSCIMLHVMGRQTNCDFKLVVSDAETESLLYEHYYSATYREGVYSTKEGKPLKYLDWPDKQKHIDFTKDNFYIPEETKKVEINYTSLNHDNKVELQFKTFKWCDN